jgi:hypothetical protein
MIFDSSNKDPLEMIAGDINQNKRQRKLKRKRLNSGSLVNTDDSIENELTQDIDIDKVFVLERSRGSTHSKGYFFLACVFGMMCGSSYLNNQTMSTAVEVENKYLNIQQPSSTSNNGGASSGKQFCVGRELKSQDFDEEMESNIGSMNLISSDVSDDYVSDIQLKELYQK